MGNKDTKEELATVMAAFMEGFKPELTSVGSVVAWDNESGYPTIAICQGDGTFSFAINYRGRKDEGKRLWYDDSLPTNKEIRLATLDEMIEILTAIGRLDKETRGTWGELIVNFDERCILHAKAAISKFMTLASGSGMRKVCETVSPEIRFNNYLKEVVEYYNTNGKLRGYSSIATKYKVGSIQMEEFFAFGLNKLKAEEVTMEVSNKVREAVLGRKGK